MTYSERIKHQISALGQVPEPSTEAIAHSESLYHTIVAELEQGPLSFHDFMHLALYAPGLGYYSAGSVKIGSAGDFITAPEMSPLFGHCLAVQAQQILSPEMNCILEFGAGTGKLACSIMSYLSDVGQLPENYYILEPSPDLKQRQQQLIQENCAHLAERFIWIDTLPESFSGVILANEVLDAMPVHLFKVVEHAIRDLAVDVNATDELSLTFTDQTPPELTDWWRTVGQALNLPDGYQSEVNLSLKPWLQSIASCLDKGLLLLLDYGFPMSEYYLPERSSGTIKCHYRHHHHNDPLQLLGLQDITAHVDFTAVAEAGFDSGFDVLGYVNQAGFLTSCGILQMAESAIDTDASDGLKQQLLMAQQIKPLIMPEEMGELFKVMALGKGIDSVSLGGLVGFRYLDQRRLL